VTSGAQVSVQARENFLKSQNKSLVDPSAKKFISRREIFLAFWFKLFTVA
jgi:hypothetical protein